MDAEARLERTGEGTRVVEGCQIRICSNFQREVSTLTFDLSVDRGHRPLGERHVEIREGSPLTHLERREDGRGGRDLRTESLLAAQAEITPVAESESHGTLLNPKAPHVNRKRGRDPIEDAKSPLGHVAADGRARCECIRRVVTDPDARKPNVVVTGPGANHDAPRRHDPGRRLRPEESHRPLRLDDDVQVVREGPVDRGTDDRGKIGEPPLERPRVDLHVPPSARRRKRTRAGRRRAASRARRRTRGRSLPGSPPRSPRHAAPGAPAAPDGALPKEAAPSRRLAGDGPHGTVRRHLSRSYPVASGGISIGPSSCTSVSRRTPKRSYARRHASEMSASASAEVAPPTFSMKFSCFGEITAPPIPKPRRPHASSMRPAVSSCSGFLKTLPNVRLFVGWAAFRLAWSSATVARISSSGRGESSSSTVATIWPGRRPERR